jgi:Putative protein-S-isoprenylcysteine methyltransferase
MNAVLKNIFSFILPFTVLVLVPWWIEKDWVVQSNIYFTGGSVLMILGLSVMAVTISSFIRIGKGTLAPWSPTKKLVIAGPYRYVRNPMIMGVMTVLLGEALMFYSISILKWSGLFFLINTAYFILSEEPQLEKRFGEDYRHYKQNVNRWLPRFTPFKNQK